MTDHLQSWVVRDEYAPDVAEAEEFDPLDGMKECLKCGDWTVVNNSPNASGEGRENRAGKEAMSSETMPIGAGESSPAPDGWASLEARMEAAIEAMRFNFLEIRGFQSKPRLALIAGAAIGYALAIKDFQKQNNTGERP